MYDFLAFLGLSELSVIERCPYYRGVRKERLEYIYSQLYISNLLHTKFDMKACNYFSLYKPAFLSSLQN